MGLDDLLGVRGTVTVAIRGPERAGEVCLPCAGGTQTFIAFASEVIPRNTAVYVYGTRPNGVEVEKA